MEILVPHLHRLVQGTLEQSEFSLETRSSRFVFPIQLEPNSNFISLKVSLVFESSDTYCRFPFNIWVRAGASAQLVRVIEINTTKNAAEFFLSLEDPGFFLMELDCDAGIFDGANCHKGRRINMTVALSEFEPDTRTPRLTSRSEPPHRTTALESSERTPRPIFVVGMYRSGTSILTWALGQHPNIWALEETGFLPMIANSTAAAWIRASSAGRSFADVYEVSGTRFSAHFAHAVDGLFMELAKEHAMRCTIERANDCAPDFDPRIQALRSLGAPKQRWVDGTPENMVAIARLTELFPEARFIHIIRDPRHVAASMTHFDRIGGDSMSPAEAMRLWYDRTSLGFLAEKALGSQVVMRIGFDELVADPRSHLNRIFTFLGEPAFDQASDCYQQRINSSNLSDSERVETFSAIDDQALGECLALYQELSDPSVTFVRPSMDARIEFDEQARSKLLEFLAT
jgi:hypothetical protein